MAATFSFYHPYGTAPATELASTGNSLNFFGGTSNTDTAVNQNANTANASNYNHTASNIQAGSNSWPIWITARFSTSGAGTFNNIKFYQYTEGAGSTFWNASASMGVVGTVQSGYTAPTSRSTATNQASSVQVPTSSSSTSAPTNSLQLGSVSTSGAGTCLAASYIVYQLTTATNAPAGDTGYAAFTLQYDEQ